MEIERVSCNICDSEDSIPLFELVDPTTNNKQVFPLVRCKSCGLVFVNPRPTVAEISKFYPENFVSYQFEVSDFDNNVSLKDRLVSLITKSINFDRIRSISKHMKLDTTTNVLDVGCGKGAYLYYLREMYGCQTVGLDFDEKSLLFCREKLNLNILMGDIKRNKEYLRTPFDLITFWAFLEHDFDPLSSLMLARERLKADGLLVVEVPNERSLENRIFGKRSFLYDVPRHLYNFSPETLNLLLEKAGFTVKRTTYPVGAGGWIGTLQRLLSNDSVYNDLRNHLPFLIIVGGLIYPLEFVLGMLRMGSVLRVFAKKQ